MSFFFLHYYPFIFCKYTKINDFHVHPVNNITFKANKQDLPHFACFTTFVKTFCLTDSFYWMSDE